MHANWARFCMAVFLATPMGGAAQTFTTLHGFTGSDGTGPEAALILSGKTLYGTTVSGGSLGVGTVFKVNTDGTGFTNLYHFTCGGNGCYPRAGLILASNTLYGTTFRGCASDSGGVFAIKTNGVEVTNLHSFAWSDGADPLAGVILSGTTLYGTTVTGGDAGSGVIFNGETDGTGFT